MTEALKNWLKIVASAAFGTSLLQMLSPHGRGNLDKYVKFVCAAVVLLVVTAPLFGILSDLDGFFDKSGIFSDDGNINVTESDAASRWILSETLTSLEDGIKKLAREKFGLEIETEISAEITENGIEIKRVTISAPTGTPFAACGEAAKYLADYLGIEVLVKNDVERLD